MGPDQVAEFAYFLLGIEFGPQVEEVQQGPQGEAHHEVLAVIKGQDAAGMFFGEAGGQQVAVALGGGAAELQIDRALLDRIVILLALAVAVIANGPEIEHLFELQLASGGPADALAGVAHRLHIKAHPHPVGAGLLHHRVGKPAHIEHDLGVLEGAVVAPLSGQ